MDTEKPSTPQAGSRSSAESASDADLKLVDRARTDARTISQSHDKLRMDDALPAFAPDAIRGYRIADEIHRGAQGIVFRATEEATGRTVAIKVMRECLLAGQHEQHRFEREVRILGELTHEHIVRILDHGVIGGRCFLVMDYISGRSLDEIWDGAAGSPTSGSCRNTAALFARIAEAVNAAHLRGVIHRDLKPGNIRIDAAGQPHILDFGLAKIASDDVSISVSQSASGRFVGSLPWSSPEQVAGVSSGIDIRTDVYSLGVLLYQALTGRFPYPVHGALRDTMNHISTTEPTPPHRHAPYIDDELQTIVLKCLQKAPERRYQSAGDLSRDLRHYLAGAPIEAKRESEWYMFTKFISRHRAAVSVVVLLSIFLIIGFVVTTMMWRLAMKERDRAMAAERMAIYQRQLEEQAVQRANDAAALANAARDAEAQQRKAAQEQLARAVEAEQRAHDANLRFELERARGEASSRFLQQVFTTADNRDHAAPSVDELLRHALLMLETAPMDDEVRQRIQQTLDGATRLLSPEQPPTDDVPEPRAGENESGSARLERQAPLKQEASTYLTAAIEVQRREVERIRLMLGEKNTDYGDALTRLARVLQQARQIDEAALAYQQAVAAYSASLGADNARCADARSGLAWIQFRRGRIEDAKQRMRETIDLRRRWLGRDHALVAESLRDLAWMCQQSGDMEGAQNLLDETLEVNRRVFGTHHWIVANSLQELAKLSWSKGDWKTAEARYREALEILRVNPDAKPEYSLRILEEMAMGMQFMDRLDDAERVLREVLVKKEAAFGANHWEIATSLGRLAFLYEDQARWDEMLTVIVRARNIAEAFPNDLHIDHAGICYRFGVALRNTGDWSGAENALRESIRIADAKSDPILQPEARVVLASLLMQMERYRDAESLLREAWLIYVASPGIGSTLIRPAEMLTACYAAMGDECEAIRWSELHAQLLANARPHLCD